MKEQVVLAEIRDRTGVGISNTLRANKPNDLSAPFSWSARTTSSTISNRDFSVQQSMRESTIGVLEIYKKQCKRDGDFRGARETKSRIGRLKQEHAIARREGMLLKHVEEQRNLQQILSRQFESYFTEWETRKLSSLKKAVDEIRSSLSQRQEEERDEFIEGLENGRIKYRVTMPPLTLDLMAKARYLVLQDRHDEAKQLMSEAEERELDRKLKQHADQQEKLARIKNQFAAQQLKEQMMTEEKIRRMKEEVLKHQRLELEELQNRAQQQLIALSRRQQRELAKEQHNRSVEDISKTSSSQQTSRQTCFSIIPFISSSARRGGRFRTPQFSLASDSINHAFTCR